MEVSILRAMVEGDYYFVNRRRWSRALPWCVCHRSIIGGCLLRS